LGLEKLSPESIKGGNTVQESAKIFENILKGKGTSAQNQVVIANSAAALVTADSELSFEEAVGKAEQVLMSGKALKVFNGLVNPKTTVSLA